MDALRKIRKGIDTLNEYVGMISKFILMVIVFSLCYEVISRYVFNSPTIWAQDISTQALCALGAFGGGYALLYNQHVRVDVFWGSWSERTRGIVDLCTSILFLTFMVMMIYRTTEMAMDSWAFHEHAATVFAPPLYYIKTLIPIGACLLFLQGIAKILHDIVAVATGVSENLKTME